MVEKMKKSIREARKYFKQSNDINEKIRVKMCKKEFKIALWRIMFIYENNKNKNIESLFGINYKDDFWKAFNSYKERDSNN